MYIVVSYPCTTYVLIITSPYTPDRVVCSRLASVCSPKRFLHWELYCTTPNVKIVWANILKLALALYYRHISVMFGLDYKKPKNNNNIILSIFEYSENC